MLKIFFLLCAAVFVTFSIVNSQKVAVSLWPFSYEVLAPLSLFLFALFVVGFFVGFLSKSLHNFFTKKASSNKDTV